jgi:hypothetical protein
MDENTVFLELSEIYGPQTAFGMLLRDTNDLTEVLSGLNHAAPRRAWR